MHGRRGEVGRRDERVLRVTRNARAFVFTKLDRSSTYNVLVNAKLRSPAYVALDAAIGTAVRNDVQLAAGPDGRHAEDFVRDRRALGSAKMPAWPG